MDKEQKAIMSDIVYEHLKNMILSLELKPGERIPEAKIASYFGISRTPIREAIKRLANDGIVVSYPNRYAEVAVYDDNWIKETGLIRISLDIIAAKLAVFHGSNCNFAVMERYLEECNEAAKTGDRVKRIKSNCAFHLELSRISQNKELLEIQERLYLKLEFMQSCHYHFVETIENQFLQHKEIVNALYSRDSDKLIYLISNHEKKFHTISDSDFKVIEHIKTL